MKITKTQILLALVSLGIVLLIGYKITISSGPQEQIPTPLVATTSDPKLNMPPVETTSTTPSLPSSTIYDFAQVIANPQQFHNQIICLRGTYQSSFEFSAFGNGFNQTNTLIKPWIWVETDIDTNQLQCERTSAGQTICRGTITSCGTFQYAAEGEKGFGHTNAYRYQLVPPTEPIKK